ncbi:MAG: pseudouridine synthase [Prosthecobacter sp.]|uniref:pseudouridine synthase n=1 Tax=Prosthecobacter sp. TaxID=1965333 RepID=UPI0038FDC76C
MRRLDQLLSSLGYCSRREAMAFVKEGRVKLGGVVVKRSDQRVDSALITVDDQPLEAPEGLLAMLHKPVGYACTHSADEGQTIYELLPSHWLDRNPAVTSVGRLDKDTSGLLLVTDLGSLVHRYTSPKSDVEKVYVAKVDHDLDPGLIDIFAKGDLMLRSEDKPCLPAKLEIVSARTARLTITEGRYHQVRRMFASQGWQVEKLHRERFGPYELVDLAEGEWRMISLEQEPR